MLARDLCSKLHDLKYTCEVNQLYHQHQAHHWWLWDKGTKIAVGLLAVFALMAIFLPDSWKWLELTLATAAAVVAVVMNVVPVGEWDAVSAGLFRGWTDLRVCAEQLEIKVCEYADEKDVHDLLTERYIELAGKLHQLNAEEPAPDKALLLRCQGDVNERTWGEGIRTNEQVEAERTKREARFAATSAWSAAAAARRSRTAGRGCG